MVVVSPPMRLGVAGTCFEIAILRERCPLGHPFFAFVQVCTQPFSALQIGPNLSSGL